MKWLNFNIRSRKITNMVRFVLDELMPPILRDQKFLISILVRLYCGKNYRNFDLDFKTKAPYLSNKQIAELYERTAGCGLHRLRDMDLSKKQMKFIMESVNGDNLLEVGCGSGYLSCKASQSNCKVVALDIAESSISQTYQLAQKLSVTVLLTVANSTHLPFGDNSFDCVICAHTLEHIKEIDLAISELKRICRKRLIIVVPKQRYYRYTIDYHLHFFESPHQLLLRLGEKNSNYYCIDGDICCVLDLDD